ncbi:MAG: hypothetical protein WCO89_00145 [Syntrophus sp. (in: bacteria)]
MKHYQCPKCGEDQRSHLTCLVDSLRCTSCETTFIIDEGRIDLDSLRDEMADMASTAPKSAATYASI